MTHWHLSGQDIKYLNPTSINELDYIGNDGVPMFFYYHKIDGTDSVIRALLMTKVQNNQLTFNMIKSINKGFIMFNNQKIEFKAILQDNYTLNDKRILNRYVINEIQISDGNKFISSCFQNNVLYLNLSFKTGIQGLFSVNSKEIQPKLDLLPIKAYNPFIQGSYLYYTIEYITMNYSDFPKSLYRVKIGDWYRPELVADNIYYVAPYYADSSYIFIKDSRKEPDGKLGIKTILLNPNTKKYHYYDGENGIPFEDHGIKYILASCKDPNTKKLIYCLESPNKFDGILPYTWNKVTPPNENWLHLPYQNKPFTGTFLEDEVICFGTKKILQKYSKTQLKIMRNSFYAREGYEFESQELQTFFNQFEWYKKTVIMKKNEKIKNEDIVLSEMDKARIVLLQEVEESK